MIGNITFRPFETDYDNRAATISAAVEGTVGTDTTPGRLMFSTAAAGANTVSERMRIDSAGKVGIGTSSPSMKLQVVDTDHEVAEFESSHSAGASIKIDATSTGGTHWKFQSTANGSSHGGGKLSIQEAGTNRVAIAGGGNVGIGTTTPGGKVDIIGSAGTVTQTTDTDAEELVIRNNHRAGISILSSDSSSRGGYIVFGGATDANAANIQHNFDAKTFSFQGQNSDMELRFASANNVEAMRIDTSQNVGIGTTAPAQKLHVEGGFRFRDGNSSSQRLEGYGQNDNFMLVVSGTDALGLAGGTPGVRFNDSAANTHLTVQNIADSAGGTTSALLSGANNAGLYFATQSGTRL